MKCGTGNSSKRPTQKYLWFFTFNNYNEQDIIRLKMRFQSLCKWYIFGEEICPSTGTPHLQGSISLKKKIRFSQIQKWNIKIRWFETTNAPATIDYCQKEGKFYTNLDLEEYNEYDDIKWKPWQKDIIDTVAKPCKSDRTVNWIWDDEGSTLSLHMTSYYDLL